jgi:hypothetical protein
MKIAPKEANDILRERFPKPEELESFPFGEYLRRLWERGDEDGAMYQEHGPKVLRAMNILLSKEPGALFEGNLDDADEQLLIDAKQELIRIFGQFNSDTRAFFRVAALYHDIGKYIIKERHPTVGWYTMEYLNPREKADLGSLLCDREDYLQLLLIMIRDHDEFGVLSTGEASYPILLRAANSLGNNIDDQKQILSAIMWLNMADIAGTPGLVITIEDIKKIIQDWKWMLNVLDESYNKNERLGDYMIQEASREDRVEERITRLLLEASRGVKHRDEELRVNSSHNHVRDMVRNAILTVYPTYLPRRDFASQLTHVCKLDYGKRFFTSLVQYYEGPPESGIIPPLPKWADTYVETEDLIYAILAILRRLTSTYSAMIHAESGTGSLIGVEMKDLTPRNAPEKTAQIIELLHNSHYPGLSWMMSDCLAWYF